MTSIRRAAGISLAVAALLVGAGCGEESGGATPSPATSRSDALTADHVVATGSACTPTGAHAKHGFTACATCHYCAGTLAFNPTGPAVSTNVPLPSFNATTKTCAVACHGVPAGTFGYYFPDGNGDPAYNEVPYGGTNQTTPSWYATGSAGCTACHGNPPQNYTWHIGHPGGQQCELCHLDAVSTYDATAGRYVATSLSTATNCGPNKNEACSKLHANGVVNVDAKFTAACVGCH